VILAFPRTVVTELTVKAPKGFRATRELDPVLVKTPFGQYSITIDRTKEGYRVSRGYVLNAFIVPPEHYSEFVDLLEAVRRADSTVLEFESVD
jgi:hypothetical protein